MRSNDQFGVSDNNSYNNKSIEQRNTMNYEQITILEKLENPSKPFQVSNKMYIYKSCVIFLEFRVEC